MDEAQPVFPIGEVIEGFDERAIDGLRALAAAKNQNRVRRLCSLRRNGS